MAQKPILTKNDQSIPKTSRIMITVNRKGEEKTLMGDSGIAITQYDNGNKEMQIEIESSLPTPMDAENLIIALLRMCDEMAGGYNVTDQIISKYIYLRKQDIEALKQQVGKDNLADMTRNIQR